MLNKFIYVLWIFASNPLKEQALGLYSFKIITVGFVSENKKREDNTHFSSNKVEIVEIEENCF